MCLRARVQLKTLTLSSLLKFLSTIPDFAGGLSQIFPIMNLAGNGKWAKNRNLNTNVTHFRRCVTAFPKRHGDFFCYQILITRCSPMIGQLFETMIVAL